AAERRRRLPARAALLAASTHFPWPQVRSPRAPRSHRAGRSADGERGPQPNAALFQYRPPALAKLRKMKEAEKWEGCVGRYLVSLPAWEVRSAKPIKKLQMTSAAQRALWSSRS